MVRFLAAFVSLFSLATPAWTDVPETKKDPSMYAYWHLDQIKGDTAQDASIYGQETRIHGAKWVEGRYRQGLGFDGQDDYVAVARTWHFDIRRFLTLEAWVKAEAAPAKDEQCVIAKSGSPLTSPYGIFINAKRQAVFSVLLADKKTASVVSVELSADWHHLALTYDGRTLSGYVDTKLVGQKEAAGELAASDAVLLIGGDKGKNSFKGTIDEVRFYERALSAEEVATDSRSKRFVIASVLEVVLHDADTYRPLEAEVRVKGSDGRYYTPFEPANGMYYDGYFYIFSHFKVLLPAGKTEVYVSRGPEYEPGRATVELKDDAETKVDIALQRWLDITKKGWYGGDLSVQTLGHGRGKLDHLGGARLNELAAMLCRAVGLHWSCVGSTIPGEYLREPNGETMSNIAGHVDWVHTGTFPSYRAPNTHFNEYDNLRIIDSAAPTAVPVPCHVFGYSAAPDDPSSNFDTPRANTGWCFNRELPIDIILGRVHTYEVNTGAKEMRDLYWYNNLGFRVSAASGTDVYLTHGGGAGGVRTYVKMESLTLENLVGGLQQGRTFVSSGPMLLFHIDGHDIGDIITLKKPLLKKRKTLTAQIEGYFLQGLGKVELIRNGKVVATFDAEGKREFKKETTLQIDETCWFGVKLYGKSGQLGYSSPIYVRYGKDKMDPDPEAIKYFLDWIQRFRKVVGEYSQTTNFERAVCMFGDRADERLKAAKVAPDEKLDKNLHAWYLKIIDKAEKVLRSLEKEGRAFEDITVPITDDSGGKK